MSRLTQNQVVTPSVRKKVLIGIVIDVVTNDEHPIITEPVKTFLVGLQIRRVDDTSSSPKSIKILSTTRPFKFRFTYCW